MNFSKADFWRAIIVGELIALLALPVFKNLGLFAFFSGFGSGIFYLCIGLWLIFLPLAAAGGLFAVFRLSVPRWPECYRIAKYGIIGLLNSFLTLGILNFLIIVSGIDRGLWFDAFYAAACAGGVTNAFFWNKFWTFNAGGTEKIRQEYVKFFAVAGTTTLINIFLMHILVNIIGVYFSFNLKIWANVSSVFLVLVSFFGNFFGWKIFVFNK